MVRFARAEGSKGSNKRQLEEPTPWEEMKKQMVAESEDAAVVKGKKKKKNKKKKEDGELEVLENGNTNGDCADADSKVPQIEDIVEDRSPDSEGKHLENGSQEKPLSKKEKKKLKLAKKSEETESKPEFIINDKGQRVKVFKDGKERIYFDLPYEEGERMSRFEGFWVKKNMVEELELLKTSLKEQGVDEQELRKKMMKKKRKAHGELRRELVLEQKALLQKNQETIQTNVEEKTGIVLERDIDGGSKTNIEANALKKKKKKIKTKKTETEGLLEAKTEINGMCEDGRGQEGSPQDNSAKSSELVPQGDITQENGSEEKEINYKPFAAHSNSSHSREKEFIPIKFEENDVMTNYDGYWVRKGSVLKLNILKKIKKEKIIARRKDGNQDDLTAEEQLKFNREMKKEKRNENRQLKMLLIHEGQKKLHRDRRRSMHDDRESTKKPRKPGKSLGINYTEQRGDMVKFDGFWVKSDSADRLKQLKERLTSEGLPKEDIDAILKRERRKEERALKNEKKIVCFKCRQPGHFASSCTKVLNSGLSYTSEGNDLCYKCGSTEHMSWQCTVKRKGSEFAYAVCFVCNGSGHIARECPDNPRGLYPKGGCCNQCGSVEHLRKDCPELQAENEKNTMKVEYMDSKAIDALDTCESQNFSTKSGPSPTKKRKVIKF